MKEPRGIQINELLQEYIRLLETGPSSHANRNAHATDLQRYTKALDHACSLPDLLVQDSMRLFVLFAAAERKVTNVGEHSRNNLKNALEQLQRIYAIAHDEHPPESTDPLSTTPQELLDNLISMLSAKDQHSLSKTSKHFCHKVHEHYWTLLPAWAFATLRALDLTLEEIISSLMHLHLKHEDLARQIIRTFAKRGTFGHELIIEHCHQSLLDFVELFVQYKFVAYLLKLLMQLTIVRHISLTFNLNGQALTNDGINQLFAKETAHGLTDRKTAAQLSVISLINNRLSSEPPIHFIKCQRLRKLDVSLNAIGQGLKAAHLPDMLETLRAYGCHLEVEAFSDLQTRTHKGRANLNFEKHCKNLKFLDVSGNEGIKFLAAYLVGDNLDMLDVSECGLQIIDPDLVESHLRELNLSHNPIGEGLNAAHLPATLEKLRAMHCDLKVEGPSVLRPQSHQGRAFLDFEDHCKKLKVLDVSRNEGIKFLAVYLVGGSLDMLDISRCGLRAIDPDLKRRCLRELNLSHNAIGRGLNAAHLPETLEELRVRDCGLEVEALSGLRARLQRGRAYLNFQKHCKNLKVLDVAENEGIKFLAEYLVGDKVHSLDASECDLRKIDLGLKDSQLRVLNLRKNRRLRTADYTDCLPEACEVIQMAL